MGVMLIKIVTVVALSLTVTCVLVLLAGFE